MSVGSGHHAHISAAVAIAAEAEIGEFWGCDIDAASVTWLQENLDPPFRAVPSGALPPLPFDDSSFDLVYCVSVFSHLADEWPHGSWSSAGCSGTTASLIATFMGEGMSESIAGEPWDENRIGMNALRYGQPWDLGGPMVLHSSMVDPPTGGVRHGAGKVFRDCCQPGYNASEGQGHWRSEPSSLRGL